MKAIIHRQYGSPNLLKIEEVKIPSPGKNEVLVRVKASSINSWDWDLVRGIPRIYRLMFGLFKPKNPIIGIDIAGIVEAIGSEVKSLKVGDEVFGDISEMGFGAFAEYACSYEKYLAPKPQRASFEEAATLAHAGLLALLAIHHDETPKANQKILINGAGGSTGPFAIQMAKMYGAEITCVDSKEKQSFLATLGAQHFIDYKLQDFTKTGEKYDLIIDLIADKSVWHYNSALLPKGALIVVGGTVKRLIQIAFWGLILGKVTGKKFALLMHQPNTANLSKLATLFDEGKIKAIIDKRFSFEQIPEAINYLGKGLQKGKLVIKM